MARTTLTTTILAVDNATSNITTLLTTGGNVNAIVPANTALVVALFSMPVVY